VEEIIAASELPKLDFSLVLITYICVFAAPTFPDAISESRRVLYKLTGISGADKELKANFDWAD
jgi:hypothetical protein